MNLQHYTVIVIEIWEIFCSPVKHCSVKLTAVELISPRHKNNINQRKVQKVRNNAKGKLIGKLIK